MALLDEVENLKIQQAIIAVVQEFNKTYSTPGRPLAEMVEEGAGKIVEIVEEKYATVS